MIPIAELRNENIEIENLRKILAVLVGNAEMHTNSIFCELLERFQAKLNNHLKHEARSLYPDLLTNDDKELKTLYSAADVVVFLDCSPYGCLGLVMVEAMACRTPVIAFNVCGVPEATIDGETGFLIPMGDVNQLSEKIITMIRNPELSKKMGNKGRNRVENVFATQLIALQYKKLLIDMIDRKIGS